MPENRIHIFMCVGNRDRGRKLSGYCVQKLLNHLIADYAATLAECLSDKIARDLAFGFWRLRVDLYRNIFVSRKALTLIHFFAREFAPAPNVGKALPQRLVTLNGGFGPRV